MQKSQNNDDAAVWILGTDNSLSRKKIQIGIDNDTEVQVISGLTEKDKVVTGYKTLSKTSSGSSGAKSPFLPQRPGGNKGGNRSGGGSGGGGPRN